MKSNPCYEWMYEINSQSILAAILDVKARITQQFTGKIKTSTITKTPTGQYFVCVLVETEETLPIPTTISKEETLGIDVGINHFATLSNGFKIANEKHFF